MFSMCANSSSTLSTAHHTCSTKHEVELCLLELITIVIDLTAPMKNVDLIIVNDVTAPLKIY